MIFYICLPLLLLSCFNKGKTTGEMDQLNQRITSLEQRIDSLISSRNINSVGLNNMNNSGISSYNISPQSVRCLAMTKKGTQCKRKAKNNGYCWQHGGQSLVDSSKSSLMESKILKILKSNFNFPIIYLIMQQLNLFLQQ